MYLDDAHELGLEYLTAILLCLFIMWLCYRLQMRRARETTAHIGFIIRSENDRRQETSIAPMRGGATELRQKDRRDANTKKTV